MDTVVDLADTEAVLVEVLAVDRAAATRGLVVVVESYIYLGRALLAVMEVAEMVMEAEAALVVAEAVMEVEELTVVTGVEAVMEVAVVDIFLGRGVLALVDP